MRAPLPARFYGRPVLEVAPDLVGCVVAHGDASGVIVETEAYHQSEAACHAHIGLTRRTRPLFSAPGTAYVYRSYGIHALLNAVCEPEHVGAAVLIRALEPLSGIERMRERRGPVRLENLCSGPGKLTQALGVELEVNATSLVDGPVVISAAAHGWEASELIAEERIRADPTWQRGAAHRSGGSGHPEASVAEHIDEVLANVDRFATDPQQRARLRLIALVHDSLKHEVRWWRPGHIDHARLARRFAERHVDDPGVLKVIGRHDDAFRAWRCGRRTGLWWLAERRARRLVRDLGPDLELYRAFYRCDNETGDKAPDDRRWFERLLA